MYPYPNAEIEYLQTAVDTLRHGGRADIAESTAEALEAIAFMTRSGSNVLMLSAAEELPGWRALAYFAARELFDPSTPRVGDRVRLTYGAGKWVTGEWRYEDQPEEGEQPRPYVQLDDDGSHHTHIGGNHVQREITRRTTPADGWDRHLEDAATVIHSAWTSSPRPDDVALDAADVDELDGCHGCGDRDELGTPRCDKTAECTGRRHLGQRHQRTRWCPCGAPAIGCVVAWLAVPQYAPAADARDTDAAFTAIEEVGGAGVCGPTCTQSWIRRFRPKLVETLGAVHAAEVRYRIDYSWDYEPNDLDLTGPLYAARTAAHTAAEHLSRACIAWIQPGHHPTAAERIVHAKAETSRLLDALTKFGTE